ncbi:DUF6252 family protein [uncultured Dokdonia sp.]|uniref:DUF6252 family protein n=1 Tax=uncultured Dokdonia sp. TaxID=575653 RepID=UPI002621070D|nr:DUF6252 family protein [uncultured Dokdonia sp.]
MKNAFFKCTLLLFAFVLVASCSSDDSGPAEAPPVKLRASVNGTNIRTDNVTATLSNNGRRLSIVAPTELGQLVITIGSNDPDAPEITAQTYLVDDTGNVEIRISSADSNFTSTPELGGGVTISEINTQEMTLFGSFAGTIVSASDSDSILSITNGALFNVNFIVQ